MGISLSAQTAYFLWSLVLGVALGALYDVIRGVRMVLHAGKIHVLISDIVFFAACGVITSLFSLPFNKGDVRAFILFGEAVGFLAYRLTFANLGSDADDRYHGVNQKRYRDQRNHDDHRAGKDLSTFALRLFFVVALSL